MLADQRVSQLGYKLPPGANSRGLAAAKDLGSKRFADELDQKPEQQHGRSDRKSLQANEMLPALQYPKTEAWH